MIMRSVFFFRSKLCHVNFENTIIIFLLLVFHCFVFSSLMVAFLYIVLFSVFCGNTRMYHVRRLFLDLLFYLKNIYVIMTLFFSSSAYEDWAWTI
jgi:hypothetical protein